MLALCYGAVRIFLNQTQTASVVQPAWAGCARGWGELGTGNGGGQGKRQLSASTVGRAPALRPKEHRTQVKSTARRPLASCAARVGRLALRSVALGAPLAPHRATAIAPLCPLPCPVRAGTHAPPVNADRNLLLAEEQLLKTAAAAGLHHAGNAGRAAPAHVVEVQHALRCRAGRMGCQHRPRPRDLRALCTLLDATDAHRISPVWHWRKGGRQTAPSWTTPRYWASRQALGASVGDGFCPHFDLERCPREIPLTIARPARAGLSSPAIGRHRTASGCVSV
eukprot:350180-Chlamydomonas_euryale.AAC.5